MKRKFIRTLLFGALIGLQATAFVSCKDYDDDIAALRSEITTNATDLKSLVDEKMKNVETQISTMQSTVSGLESAYKAADKALEDAITNATNDAKGYAEIQAGQAQTAAIAAAKSLVEDAAAKLQASLDAAEARISKNEESVIALIAADAELQNGIDAAMARANEAYTLAEGAKTLAEENETKLGELADALDALNTSLESQIRVFGEMLTDINTKIAEQGAALKKDSAILVSLQESYATLSQSLNANDSVLKALADANKYSIDSLSQIVKNIQLEAISTSLQEAKDYADSVAAAKAAAAITSVKATIGEVKFAYGEAEEGTELKDIIADLDSRVANLEGKLSTVENDIIGINTFLSILDSNLNNMITSLIVQAQKQQFVYGKVLSTVNAGFAVGGTTKTYTKVEGNQTVVYFPYIGATNAKGDLVGGQYNVEKNGGLVYFTINPTNVNFEDNANIQMENSLGDAPKTATGEIAVGAPKNAVNHLITRAANVENKNGLYSARLTYTNTDKTKAPAAFKNSYALYTKYNTYAKDEKGNKVATEKRVYSKYEVNLSFTQAYGYVTGEMVAVGDNFYTTMPGVDYKFVSKFGDPMTGVLDLKPVTVANDINNRKAFRKYVEIVAVKNTHNEVLTGNNLKAVIEKMTAANPEALQKVLEEPAGEPQNVEEQENGFDRITLNMPYEEYKGYKFTLNYYVQSYTGNVTASQKVIMFAQPLFECNLIHVKHTPTSAAMQESASKETEFLASACLTNLDKWAKNTSNIVVTFDKEDKANINDVKFYDNEANQALIAKASTGEAWVFENLTEATIRKFKNLTIEYNPAKLKVEHPYQITLTSYDVNGNEVCIQDVEFTMTHPTACNGLIQPNPLFFVPFNKELTELSEAYTLTAWAMHSRNQDGYYGYYNVITAFNEYKDNHGCVLRFDIQADKKAGYETAGEFAALKPISQYPFRPILDWGDESTRKAAYIMQAPVTALEYGKEHVYPMCVGVEYYGVSSLWYDNQKFNLVFKSPIAWAEAKFAKAFNIGYPSKSLLITDADITADDPSTSAVDDIKYFGAAKDQRINGDVKVELVETQFRSIFKTLDVTGDGIKIETAEEVYGGVGSIEGQEIHINMIVKDYFGNTRKYPFTVVLANND